MKASLHTRSALLAAAFAASFSLSADSFAAAVETDRDCYLERSSTNVMVRGSDFVPGSAFDVLLDGAVLNGGSSIIGGDGAMSGSFTPPGLPKTVVQRSFTLGLRTADASPTTSFTVTRLLASFWPNKGTATKLNVRFSLFGFGLGGPVSQTYVHYVNPRGHLAKTVRLGRPRGQCGAIPKTSRKRLFPLKSVCPGSWRLQFDTRSGYTPGNRRRTFLHYIVKVRVKQPRDATGSVARCR